MIISVLSASTRQAISNWWSDKILAEEPLPDLLTLVEFILTNAISCRLGAVNKRSLVGVLWQLKSLMSIYWTCTF